MLRHIHIRHFAIVDQLELELAPGMTVLTGETGAGKSILLDALGLALGDRADTGIMRNPDERAEVTVDFDIQALKHVKHWLVEHELDDDEQCLIRRTINKDGRSKGYINGRPAPMQLLRELGEMLVDIHGQHAHQSLLKRDIQRQALDDFAAHEKLLAETESLFLQWKSQQEQLAQLQASHAQREDRLELLRYQVGELEALALQPGEVAELDAEHDRLANLNQLMEGSQQVVHALSDDEDSLLVRLETMSSQIERLKIHDNRLGSASEALQSAAIQASEAAHELRAYLDGLTLDPARLQEVNERLSTLHDLARKHGCTPETLPQLLEQLQEELADLDNAHVHLDTQQNELAQTEARYQDTAKQLSDSRAKSAKKLGTMVSKNMAQLGMKDGKFEIRLIPKEHFSNTGLEHVEFYVTTNPGQAPQPMAKVASGGELSRISLAIQVIIAGKGRIPTLIFDEVDVGIGGGIAEIVGRLLRNLSNQRQVLCVTHQPQVASLAHQHLQVSKQTQRKTTQTSVAELDPEARVDEIARMLGGVEITEQTLSHAREMVEMGQQASIN
jgi:DNA repair protein RecN (Recombination protein N)